VARLAEIVAPPIDLELDAVEADRCLERSSTRRSSLGGSGAGGLGCVASLFGIDEHHTRRSAQ